MLNKREDFIFNRSQELNKREKDLAAEKSNLENDVKALNEEKCNLELKLKSLSAREEVSPFLSLFTYVVLNVYDHFLMEGIEEFVKTIAVYITGHSKKGIQT